MKIENQIEKEIAIFDKLGDTCTPKEYIDEFTARHPDDVRSLYEIFKEGCKPSKSVERYVKNYLRRSFVNGRLRYRILMGIVNGIQIEVKVKKREKKIPRRHYLVTDMAVINKIFESKLLDKLICVKPDKNNAGKHLWYFQKVDEITEIIKANRGV